MGHSLVETKGIEAEENKHEKRTKYNTYEKIKDIVLKNGDIPIEKSKSKKINPLKNNSEKNKIDIGL